MSRSGYAEDIDDTWAHICWRGAVASATRGKRGQEFFKELLAALDAMPEKKLITEELEAHGCFARSGFLAQNAESIWPASTHTTLTQLQKSSGLRPPLPGRWFT